MSVTLAGGCVSGRQREPILGRPPQGQGDSKGVTPLSHSADDDAFRWSLQHGPFGSKAPDFGITLFWALRIRHFLNGALALSRKCPDLPRGVRIPWRVPISFWAFHRFLLFPHGPPDGLWVRQSTQVLGALPGSQPGNHPVRLRSLPVFAHGHFCRSPGLFFLVA